MPEAVRFTDLLACGGIYVASMDAMAFDRRPLPSNCSAPSSLSYRSSRTCRRTLRLVRNHPFGYGGDSARGGEGFLASCRRTS